MRKKLYEIIFEAETRAGKIFDVILLWLIVLSVATVVFESVESLGSNYKDVFIFLEWTFTMIFTVEYILRLYCAQKPWKYALSFYGLVDLLATIPGYLVLFVDGGASLMVIRGFRLMRVFRLFKLGRYVGESEVLIVALKSSRYKITVFLISVISLAVAVGALMYLIEGRENGFTSIPRSVYWAIVTITTVGYGDIAPQTVLGQALASMIMIVGYGIIAVPTGIVSVELAEAHKIKEDEKLTEVCPHCMEEGHEGDAHYCRKCGGKL